MTSSQLLNDVRVRRSRFQCSGIKHCQHVHPDLINRDSWHTEVPDNYWDDKRREMDERHPVGVGNPFATFSSVTYNCQHTSAHLEHYFNEQTAQTTTEFFRSARKLFLEGRNCQRATTCVNGQLVLQETTVRNMV